MKTRISAALAFLALALPLAGQAAGHEHHEHHDHGAPTLQLNAGKKWASDAPLRQAMGHINQAMADALPRIHTDQFKDADYQALAKTVNDQVAYAVANCKLAPRADAMLHGVIAELLAGAAGMEGKEGEARHDGAVTVLKALDAYGRYFQHPGWKTARG